MSDKLERFHECENCKTDGDVKWVCHVAGEFLNDKLSPKQMAASLASLVGGLAERQEDPDVALENFIEYMRAQWKKYEPERRERLAKDAEEKAAERQKAKERWH